MTPGHPGTPENRCVEGSRKPARRDRKRLIGAFVLGGLAVLFAVLNLDDVEVSWIIGTWETPLIVVIAVSILIGAAIGAMLTRRRSA